MKIKTAALLIACALCLEWTRLSGTVKAVNLKASTLTIQNRDGDLLTVPIDYQVSITDKHEEIRTLKTVRLDDKVILVRIQSDAPVDDTSGLAPRESPPHGQ